MVEATEMLERVELPRSGHAGSARVTASPLRDRILDATVECISRAGVSRTTIDDIARVAGCGRATVYRSFSGKEAVVAAAGERELHRFLAGLGDEVDACDTLEDALVAGISRTTELLASHDALRYLVANEPAVLRPMLAFDGLGPLLRTAAGFAEAHLARFLPPVTARSVGEWAARLVVVYAYEPPPTGRAVDLSDERSARDLVRTFLLAGPLGRHALSAQPPHTSTGALP